jgi:murein L,D-transpeptidase YcbB/YkuD
MTARRLRTTCFAIMALAAFSGCKGTSKRPRYTPGTAARVLKVEMDSLRPAIAAHIDKAQRPDWVSTDHWKKVHDLYAHFQNAPLWLEEQGAKDRATALLDAIHAAPEHALDTTAYPISAIQRVVDAKRLTDTASATTLAEADVLLTSAYVAYASDMLVGQVDPKAVSQAWHIPADTRELDSAIVRGIEDSDMKLSLAEMAPQDPDYAILKTAYGRYREIAARGGWPEVPKGAGATRDAALHARLDAELAADSIGVPQGDTAQSVPIPAAPPTDSAPAKPSARAAHGTESALKTELKGFQERHGLERTGVLDKQTIEEIDVPAETRVRQIAANMERHRWLPRSLGSRYIYVNVPAFRLDAYDSGQKQLSMKVVVGAEYEGKVTPVFSDSMETVVFRPYWNITPDIQRKEIGPKAASDPGYLDRNNMEYYKDGGETRIRQRPGLKNSLGLVKFLFPNSFNIYLHDTPAKSLFQQTNRAASHGCIRLEKPAELAQWVLGWDPGRVDEAMNNGADNHGVRIPQKIPVYIVYFTTYVRDGRLYFGDDIYGRDDVLVKQVAEQAHEGTATRLAEVQASRSAPVP